MPSQIYASKRNGLYSVHFEIKENTIWERNEEFKSFVAQIPFHLQLSENVLARRSFWELDHICHGHINKKIDIDCGMFPEQETSSDFKTVKDDWNNLVVENSAKDEFISWMA